MDAEAVAEVRVRRPVSVATVLAVAVLLFAVATGAWGGWQLTADGRPPAAFQERSPLPQCPRIIVAQSQPVPASLQDCLLSSDAQRRGAEVVVSSSTTEGDPIETSYRALPGGGVEVFTDATADSFGSGGWNHVRCPDVAASQTWDSCRPA